jgi:beta-glucosidase
MVQHQARQADVVVLVLGECPAATGEANAVADLGLPAGQGEMLERLVSLGVPVVLVVIAGRPLVLPAAADRCAAILWSFHPGTEGARGLADVLCGKAEPGGRLPVTFPRHLGQVPIYHDHLPTGRPLFEYERREGDKGFYRYLDCQGQPQFPFGFGLGYTEFELDEARVIGTPSLAGGIRVEVPVRNVGARAGSTVVQMYLGDPVAELSQPVRRLVAFRRVELGAGAQSTVPLEVAPESLEYTHRDGQRRSDPGEIVLMIGQSSTDVRRIRVTMSAA